MFSHPDYVRDPLYSPENVTNCNEKLPLRPTFLRIARQVKSGRSGIVIPEKTRL